MAIDDEVVSEARDALARARACLLNAASLLGNTGREDAQALSDEAWSLRDRALALSKIIDKGGTP